MNEEVLLQAGQRLIRIFGGLEVGMEIYWGGGKLCGGFVWGLALLQTRPTRLPFFVSAPAQKHKNSFQFISDMNKYLFGKDGIFKLEEDPGNLLLSLDHVHFLSSGFSKHRDFIRYLPLHLSKYILSMWAGEGIPRRLPAGPGSRGFWVHLLSFSPRVAG